MKPSQGIPLASQPAASCEEWVAARKELLQKEKALVWLLDGERALHLRLPWVKVERLWADECHGTSLSCRGRAGEVFHTCSSLARGGNALMGTHSVLDLIPFGCHDQYNNATN